MATREPELEPKTPSGSVPYGTSIFQNTSGSTGISKEVLKFYYKLKFSLNLKFIIVKIHSSWSSLSCVRFCVIVAEEQKLKCTALKNGC